jgi:hypothetical protein
MEDEHDFGPSLGELAPERCRTTWAEFLSMYYTNRQYRILMNAYARTCDLYNYETIDQIKASPSSAIYKPVDNVFTRIGFSYEEAIKTLHMMANDKGLFDVWIQRIDSARNWTKQEKNHFKNRLDQDLMEVQQMYPGNGWRGYPK